MASDSIKSICRFAFASAHVKYSRFRYDFISFQLKRDEDIYFTDAAAATAASFPSSPTSEKKKKKKRQI